MRKSAFSTTIRSFALTIVAAAAWVGVTAAVQPAQAGTVILEGSDAIGLHSNFAAGAAIYRDQAFNAIGGASALTIGVIGSGNGAIVSGSHAITDSATVAGLGPLSNYVALYFIAGGGGCCQEDDTTIGAPGATAAVTAYLAGGGTVMIENYTGGAAWDFAVGTGGAGNAHVAGIGGGFPSSLGCSDGEKVTAAGTTNGFTQPPSIGCWTHQGYDQSFFGPLGFNLSFFDSPVGLGIDGFSSLLSHGTTVSAPEPVSIALLGLGLAGIGVIRRRR